MYFAADTRPCQFSGGGVPREDAMKSSGNHERGSTKDAVRPGPAGLGRRDLMKGSVGIVTDADP